MILSRTSRLNDGGVRRWRWSSAVVVVLGAGLCRSSAALAQDRDASLLHRITATAADSDTGDLWIATLGRGLVRQSAGQIDGFDQLNSGLAGNWVFSVVVGGGRVFAATNGGVSVFDPATEAWDLLDPRRSDRSGPVMIDLAWANDTLFARKWPQGSFRWDETRRNWAACSDFVFADHATTKSPTTDPAMGTSAYRNLAVAVLGPGTRRMALPGDEVRRNRFTPQPDLVAAQVTIALANQRGKLLDGNGFELSEATPGYDRYGWGLLEDDLTVHADRPTVMGVIADLDDRQRYAEVAASLLGLPVVNLASQPAKEEPVPAERRWVFRCWGDEPRRLRALLDAVVEVDGRRRWLVVTTAGDDESLVRTQWATSYAKHRGLADPVVVTCDDTSTDAVDGASQAVSRGEFDALLFFGNARPAAQLLRAVRSRGWNGLFVGGSRWVAAEFTEFTGHDERGVVALTPPETPIPCPAAFTQAYSAQRSSPAAKASADAQACRTHLATEHLLAAIGAGGADRSAVRGALLEMEAGPFGERHFETMTPSPSTVSIARLHDGQWKYEQIPAHHTPPPP